MIFVIPLHFISHTNQLIVLVSSSHWGEEVEAGLESTIGEEYLLINEATRQQPNEKEVSEVVVNKVRHVVAKFNSDQNKTSILKVKQGGRVCA